MAEVQYLSRDDPRMQFRIYGKTVQLPRDKTVYGEVVIDEEKKERVEPFYKYAKDTPPVESWKETYLRIVAEQLKATTGQACNHVVVNQYPDGDSYIGYHRDKDETFEIGSSRVARWARQNPFCCLQDRCLCWVRRPMPSGSMRSQRVRRCWVAA